MNKEQNNFASKAASIIKKDVDVYLDLLANALKDERNIFEMKGNNQVIWKKYEPEKKVKGVFSRFEFEDVGY